MHTYTYLKSYYFEYLTFFRVQISPNHTAFDIFIYLERLIDIIIIIFET